MSASLAHQTILITGASMGIGEFVARELARLGAELILVARSEEKLRSLCQELQTDATPARYLVCDLSQPDQVAALGERLAQLPRLDGIVHNAGIGLYGSFETTDDKNIRKLFEVNFFSVLNLTRRLIPLLRKAPRPRVMLVSSVVAWRSVPLLGIYCASKAALSSFAEALRGELAPLGIPVVNACPGPTRTAFSSNAKSTGQHPFSTEKRGMPAEKVARKLALSYIKGRRDEFVSWGNRLLIWGNFLCPRLIDWALGKYFRNKKIAGWQRIKS